jgi:tetratricopeptide (TPR) repeat protein
LELSRDRFAPPATGLDLFDPERPTPESRIPDKVPRRTVTTAPNPAPNPDPPESAPGSSPPSASNPPANDAGSAQTPVAAAGDEFVDELPLTPELIEEEAYRGDFVMRWGVVLMALLLGLSQIGTGESPLLLHIRTGEHLASHGVLPGSTDPFTYTAADRVWVNLSWGFDLIAAGLHSVGGFAAISLLKGVVAAVLFWCVVHSQRTSIPTWWGAVCGAAALLAIQPRLVASPFLMTCLGTGLVLYALIRRENEPASRPWWLIGLFFVWSNLDPRMYIGLVLLLLYAVGESVTGPNTAAGATRRPASLWPIIGGCCVAIFVHPFTWRVATGPWIVNVGTYVAARDYLDTPRSVPALVYFPITTGNFWLLVDTAGLAAIGIVLLGGVMFVLNARRLVFSHLLMYLASVVAAAWAVHELPIAVIVSAVTAALNGQAWYAANFRQTYSIDTLEVMWSRGGRAITVVSMAMLAFVSSTGLIRSPGAPRVGFGLEPSFAANLDSLKDAVANTHDDRSFNSMLTMGDQLIWCGKQVFADSRFSLFADYSRREDSPLDSSNILDQHRVLRAALRQFGPDERPSLENEQLRTAFLERYKFSHAVLRLSGIPDEYAMAADLWKNVGEWRLTALTGTVAVLHRIDTNDAALSEFAETHKVQFQKEAFLPRQMSSAIRQEGAYAPGFHEKYIWTRSEGVAPESTMARNLLALRSVAMQADEGNPSTPLSMLILAVRRAQEGVTRSPQQPEGYAIQATAYLSLGAEEVARIGRDANLSQTRLRYLQAVMALHQAIRINPDDFLVHLQLGETYLQMGRLDLADREFRAALAAVDALKQPIEIASVRERLLALINELSDRLGPARDRLAEAESKDPAPAPVQLVLSALQLGLPLRAIEILKANLKDVPPQFGFVLRELELEAGLWDERKDPPEQLEPVVRQSGSAEIANTVACMYLSRGDYDKAVAMWKTYVSQMQSAEVARLLSALAPRAGGWPLPLIAAVDSFESSLPEDLASIRLRIAQVELERGNTSSALEQLREILAFSPGFSQRALVADYLQQVTGEWIDRLSPYEEIPLLFADDPTDAGEAGQAAPTSDAK